jgi:hypothetical protein
VIVTERPDGALVVGVDPAVDASGGDATKMKVLRREKIVTILKVVRFLEREVDGAAVQFVKRADALESLKDVHTVRARNYELEQTLSDVFGGTWVVTDWCPFNGRFCALDRYVPYPHPPLSGVPVKPPVTAVPWNEFDVNKIPETDPTGGGAR